MPAKQPIPGARRAAALLLAVACWQAAPGVADEHGDAVLVASIAAADIAGFNAPADGRRYRRELVGLFVDGSERDGLFVIAKPDGYLLPLAPLLQSLGASYDYRGGEVRVTTPSGDVRLAPEGLATVEGELMIDLEAADDQLRLRARFDRASYALYMSPPWSQPGASRTPGTTGTARFTPPSASLRNLRADFTYFDRESGTDFFGEYFAAGNLAGGTWQARVEQDADDDFTPFDYFWHRAWDRSQALLGNRAFSLHPLLPSVQQTGAQAVFSNQGFATDASRALIAAQGARDVGTGTRRISGFGEPGAIAELRLNGGVIARTRVRLDGTFEFTDVDVPTRSSADLKVLLLDRSSGVLLDTLDYSQRGGEGLLNSGQHTLFLALGEEGNSFDDRIDSRGTAGAAHYRYGVSERITVEIGHQDNGNESAALIGTSLSVAEHWFTSLAYTEADETDALEFAVDGGNGAWSTDLRVREFWTDRPGERRHQWERFANYRYQLAPRFTVGAAGRDQRLRGDEVSFLLPTLSWGDGRFVNFSAWPNIEGNYRVDTRLTPTYQDIFRYTYEEDNHFLDYRRRTGGPIEPYANFRDGDDFDPRTEAGITYFGDSRLFERVQVGAVTGDGEWGYVAQWDARLLPGVYSRLRVSDNAYNNSTFDFDDGFTLQWDVTVDFAVSRGRLVAADTNLGRADSAALVGPVLVNGEPASRDLNIERLVLVVDGITHTATVQGGEYYVDGLSPGLRRVSVESRHLPIQLVPTPNQVHWVQLARSAATTVPVSLEVRLAAAGKVRDAAGNAQAGLRVRVLDASGREITTLTTDRYGFYRVDNLAPGNYRVVVMRDGAPVASRDVSVTGEFLFGQDLVVP